MFRVSLRFGKPSVTADFAVTKRAPPQGDAHPAFQTAQQTYPTSAGGVVALSKAFRNSINKGVCGTRSERKPYSTAGLVSIEGILKRGTGATTTNLSFRNRRIFRRTLSTRRDPDWSRIHRMFAYVSRQLPYAKADWESSSRFEFLPMDSVFLCPHFSLIKPPNVPQFRRFFSKTVPRVRIPLPPPYSLGCREIELYYCKNR
jgi:hypothetical protein